ncbi:MAG: hypothetical protein IT536_19570 [Hyphomicrobiales bacterium]|nr:hypothetical protein [Hyphomicrobiales bacterium]
MAAEPRHLPHAAPIEAHGKGGFRFAGMSHRGSLLCLPDGIWAWPPRRAAEITEATLAEVFERAPAIDLLLIGTGVDAWAMPQTMRQRLRSLAIAVEVTSTGSAVSTYNILLGEGRRVAAALIADE